MIRPSPWPELDRLARFVRASDSLTDTLAVWTGRGLAVEIVNRVDGVCPDPLVADSLALYDGARVQDRTVLMRCGDLVVAAARSWVAADSPALTPAIRMELRDGGSLGDLLRPLHRRRVAVQVTALRNRPAAIRPRRCSLSRLGWTWVARRSPGARRPSSRRSSPRAGAPHAVDRFGSRHDGQHAPSAAGRRNDLRGRRRVCTGHPARARPTQSRHLVRQRRAAWIACAGQVMQGVVLGAVLTLAVAVVPTLIVAASFANRDAYWRTTRLDLVCLALAGAAVVVLLTSSGDLAIAMGITARGLGAVPTVVKAWRAPRTEQTTVYAAGVFGAVCTLVAAPGWEFRTVGFAVYFLLFCTVMTVLVSRGEQLARQTLRHEQHAGPPLRMGNGPE